MLKPKSKPPKDRTEAISFRHTTKAIAAFDKLCADNGTDRSDGLRQLVDNAINPFNAEWVIRRVVEDFPGLIDGETDTNGSDLIETLDRLLGHLEFRK
jgi:hypothetical protein